MAMIIRAQLFGPDNHIVPDSQYNELFAHARHDHAAAVRHLTPPPGRGRRVQVPGFGLHGLGLHGLTVCDAA
jgi:hypothetical protein